jgi:hypothetical protein
LDGGSFLGLETDDIKIAWMQQERAKDPKRKMQCSCEVQGLTRQDADTDQTQISTKIHDS